MVGERSAGFEWRAETMKRNRMGCSFTNSGSNYGERRNRDRSSNRGNPRYNRGPFQLCHSSRNHLGRFRVGRNRKHPRDGEGAAGAGWAWVPCIDYRPNLREAQQNSFDQGL
jgi:hypothetical protein